MELTISQEELFALTCRQLQNLFLLKNGSETDLLRQAFNDALTRAGHCFSYTRFSRYYWQDGRTFFNPFNGAQYCIFLYYLANTLWRNFQEPLICDKVYGLNRALHAVDLFYEVQLPDVFFTDHPVGSVMGRATYGRYFSFIQNCTVGNNDDGSYPVFGENVRMLSASRVVGNSQIGDNVIIASGTFIKNEAIPSCSLVFGQSPHLVIKPRSRSYFRKWITEVSPS